MSAKQMSTPDRSTAAAFPRYLTGEVVADSGGAPVAGTLCSGLAASARGGSFSRAGYTRATHFLHAPGHGGIPGTRRWRCMDHSENPYGRPFRHAIAHALRSRFPIPAR